MEKEFIYPNFEHSNLNISATLAEFLGAPNKKAVIEPLKKELEKGYKNVVFICFDGMGVHPMRQNFVDDNILTKNVKDILTSTFPSTTTNATNSLLQNKLPSEHGWFGWSLNFYKMNRNINIFLNTDSWTSEPVEITDSPLDEVEFYFDKAKSNYEINTVLPPYVKVKHPERNYTFSGLYEFGDYIKEVCDKDGRQFVYAYYPDPDATMHDYGVTSPEAQAVLEDIAELVENLYKETKDTIFIISADHGQVDIEGWIPLYEDKEIMDMLEIYPYLEARAACFKVKEDKKQEFEKVFNSKYSEDFILYKSSDLIEKGLFGGKGDKCYLLGDYIAIGTYTHKTMLLNPSSHKFKGHHTSLTEEMEVPLIVLKN